MKQVVNAPATTTSISLATSGSPSLTGASVTYTAMVSPSPPDGETVAFSDGGSTISACAAQMLSSGVATCAVTYSSTGSHSITASYGGDGTFDAAGPSNTVNQVVNAPATTTSISLATSGSPSLTGASVTYTAMVSPSPPDGETVAFSDGGSTISACAAQMLSSGVATCAVTYSSTGSHSITASYGGDGTFDAAGPSNTVNQVVNAPATTTSISLATSGSPSLTGASVTYRATVTPSPNGGTVAFSDGGSTIGGCGTRSLSSGLATCAVTYSSTGSHSITATYVGDANLSLRGRQTR